MEGHSRKNTRWYFLCDGASSGTRQAVGNLKCAFWDSLQCPKGMLRTLQIVCSDTWPVDMPSAHCYPDAYAWNGPLLNKWTPTHTLTLLGTHTVPLSYMAKVCERTAVFVLFPNSCNVKPQHIHDVSGKEDLIIHCTSQSSPSLLITWTKGGANMNYNFYIYVFCWIMCGS